MTKILIILTFIFLSCSDKNNPKDEKINQNIDIGQNERKSIHQEEWERYNKDNITTEASTANFNIIIENTESITEKNIGFFNFPKFTLDGENIVFTTKGYSELWIYNLENKLIEKIISLPQCGYKYQISDDGNNIYFRSKETDGKRSGGTYSIFQYSINNKSLDVIYSSSKRLSPPLLIEDFIYFLEDDKPIALNLNNKNISNKFHYTFFYVANNQLIRVSDRIDTLSFQTNFKFINCSYSKDKENIIALTANNGIILLDLDANFISRFKDAKTLKKLYKSNLVLYTKERDDGMKTISSTLHIGFNNSSKSVDLGSNISELIFNPDWSPTDNKIVYSNNNGKIKIISFNIETIK